MWHWRINIITLAKVTGHSGVPIVLAHMGGYTRELSLVPEVQGRPVSKRKEN